MYSHSVTTFRPTSDPVEPAARERPRAPVSADSTGAAIAADRPHRSRSPARRPPHGSARARRRPGAGRDRRRDGLRRGGADPAAVAPPPRPDRRPRRAGSGRATRSPASTPTSRRASLRVYDAVPDDAEAVFLALPHGAAAGRIDEFLDRGQTVIDLGPDFRLHDPADYPRWYHFDHPRAGPARDGRLRAARAAPRRARRGRATRPGAIVGAPGCYATTTILALAPLARAGLIGDLVVDAKSGVSGAGRDPKADLQFGEVNESVKAYGIFTHRHIGEIEQELGALGGGGGEPGRPRRRLPAPPHPDDPRDPVRVPRPADPRGDPGGARRRCTATPTATSRS